MRRLALLALATTAAIAAGGAAATAASAASPTARARLQGEFRMTGQITAALHVPGERRGNRVVRLWVFTPRCASGACSRVTLVRTTAHGRDRLQLRRRAAGYYTGTGLFDAPVRCGGKTYKRGSAVPFVITVRITGATVSGGVTVASAVKATYRSRTRVNRTPCVKLPARDAAKYRGKLVTLTPPPGAP
jgi:hypothetical protein